MSGPGRGRVLVLGLLAAAAVAAVVGYQLRRAHRPPSILLVLVDTLRADYLGAYGFTGGISPNLDRLAAESVVFDHCFSPAPWTKPAVASLFTSLLPRTHNVLTHKGRYIDRARPVTRTDALSARATTLAEALQAGGYATAAFVANPWVQPDQGFGQGFDHFDGRFAGNTTPAAPVLAAAQAWLATRPRDRPFFAYIHLMDVHGPYDAPAADFEAVRASPDLGPPHRLDDAEVRAIRPYLTGLPWVRQPGARERRTWRARYAAGVHALDRQLGPFLDALHADGTLAETVVVVVSDHGEELAEHGGWDHGFRLYDHQLHVPLIVRLPGGRHRRVGALVDLLDLMPTLLGIAHAPMPPGLQGRDLSRLIAGAVPDAEAGAVVAGGVKWEPGEHAIRTPTHKLITKVPSGPARLYDLRDDPAEQRDVAADAPEVAQQLAEELARRVQAPGAAPRFAPDQVEVPPALEERLESLGYVER